MFKRRILRTKAEKIREALWPSMGMKRLTLYYKHRMGRLPGTPEFIARGMAAGIAISFTPFIGFHIMIGAAICWLIRGSFLSMLLGSLLGGNFWTLPLIWIGTYKLGRLMMGKEHVSKAFNAAINSDSFSMHTLLDKPAQLLLPMTMGSVPFVIISAIAAYFITLELVRKYKAARLHRIQAKHDRQHPEDPPSDAEAH